MSIMPRRIQERIRASLREYHEMKVGRFCWMFVVVVAALASPAVAQKQPGPSAKEEVDRTFDVPAMIDQAVANISRRYNLNKTQHEFTQKMMEEGVNRFLREHQDDIYPLIRDLAGAQLKGANLSVEQRKRIGKAAQPLVEAAREAILKNNEEWRKNLSEEQKKLHDWDLKEMEGQFGQIRDNMHQMERGLAVDNPIFPEPKPSSDPPPPPRKPPDRKIALPPDPVVVDDVDGVFDRAVAKLIRDYDLDPAQAEAARSIGREYKAYAQVYRNAHKDEFEALRKTREEATKTGDLKKAQQAEEQEEKLNARIRQFLDEMKERLMSIPREAQKLAYEKKQSRGAAAAPQQKQKKKAPAVPAGREADQAKKRSSKKSKKRPAGKPEPPKGKDQ